MLCGNSVKGHINMENYKNVDKNLTGLEEWTLTELLENEAFCCGVTVGINLHQMAVVTAHKRKEPLRIGDILYYLQDGRERLQEFLENNYALHLKKLVWRISSLKPVFVKLYILTS